MRTEPGALQVRYAGHRFGGKQALRLPRLHVQDGQTLFGQTLFDLGTDFGPEPLTLLARLEQERDGIEREQRELIDHGAQQHLADGHLATLRGAADLGHLEQRRVRVVGDLQRPVGALFNILDEPVEVHRLEIGRGVGRSQIPLDLGAGGEPGCGKRTDQNDGLQETKGMHLYLRKGWSGTGTGTGRR